MLIIFCGIHLVATEYIPAQCSRGEVLLYQRGRKTHTKLENDAEAGYSDSPQDTATEMVDVDGKEDGCVTSTRSQLQERRAVFHWSRVDYSIQIKKNTRKILQNVEGWVRPGSLTALMVRSLISRFQVY